MSRIYTLKNFQDDFPNEFSGINWNHYFSKAFDQLRGICHGILADGEISDREAKFFLDWLKANSVVSQVWPFSEIANRVRKILSDNIITEEERLELRLIMDEIIDGKDVPTAGANESAWGLAFTDPEPSEIIFENNGISLTGKFAFGSRSKVVKKIAELGGFFHDNPQAGTLYLIVGEFGSPNWKNSNFGNKIQRAREISESGEEIYIVRESLFAKYAG